MPTVYRSISLIFYLDTHPASHQICKDWTQWTFAADIAGRHLFNNHHTPELSLRGRCTVSKSQPCTLYEHYLHLINSYCVIVILITVGWRKHTERALAWHHMPWAYSSTYLKTRCEKYRDGLELHAGIANFKTGYTWPNPAPERLKSFQCNTLSDSQAMSSL